MNKHYIIFFYFIIFSVSLSQENQYNIPKKEKDVVIYDNYLKDKKYQLGLSFFNQTSNSIFDKDNNIYYSFLDTISKKLFNPQLTVNTLEIFSKLNFINNYSINIRIPLSYYNLYEEYQSYFDSVLKENIPKSKKIETFYYNIDYINLEIIFNLFKSNLLLDLNVGCNIPISNKESNESKINIIYPFTINTKLQSTINFEKFHLVYDLSYIIRNKGFSDNIYSTITFGIYTIPETYISLKGIFNKSLYKIQNNFDIYKLANSEDYFDAQISFGLIIYEDINLDLNYKLRAYGRNTWNLAGYKLGIFYKFN